MIFFLKFFFCLIIATRHKIEEAEEKEEHKEKDSDKKNFKIMIN